jgi:hypothetical protein
LQAVQALVQDFCAQNFKGKKGKDTEDHLPKFLFMANHAKNAAKQNNPDKRCCLCYFGILEG